MIVGPGNLYVQEAKRQVSGRVGIDGFAGPSDLLVLASAGADPRLIALDLLAQAEHGEDSLVVAVSDDAALLDAVGRDVQALYRDRPTVAAGPKVLVDAADLDAALAFAEALAPEHLQLMGEAAEALAPRVRRAGCLFVGAASATAFGDYVAGSNHTLPTAGAARFASGLGVAHFRRRMAEVHVGGGGRRARPRGRADRARPRASPCTRSRCPPGSARIGDRMSRTAQLSRKTGETDVQVSLDLDGNLPGRSDTGVGFFDHMLDLLARHGRLGLGVDGPRATSRPGRTTPSRTPASCSARRSTRRSATAAGSAATATPSCRWTRPARPARSTSPAARTAPSAGSSCRPATIAGFEHEAAEEFFRAVASAARLTLHVELQAGTNAHHMIEACFKAFARALRIAVAVDPDETGVPSTKGTLT